MYTTVSGVIVHKGYNNFISYSQVCTLPCVLCILIWPHVYRTLTGSGRLQGRAFPYEKKKFIRKNKTTTKHSMTLHCFIKNEDDTYIGDIYTNLCNFTYTILFFILWCVVNPMCIVFSKQSPWKGFPQGLFKSIVIRYVVHSYGINMVLRIYFTGIVHYFDHPYVISNVSYIP